MPHMTNITGISLPIAAWLAGDEYDFRPGNQKAISATSLLRPIRQILLKERLTPENSEAPDVSDRIAARLGHAIHDSMEKVWISGSYRESLALLGYPEKLIDRIVVNPSEHDLRTRNDIIPVWVEQRGYREFMGYKISGKFDLVVDGELNDTKSTSTFTYTKGGKDEDYCIQGSLYRWIHKDKITSDHININFFFTDWLRYRAKQDPNYPQQRVLTHRVQLMSLQETEAWIHNRIKTLEAHADLPEEALPRCTDKDLWREETSYRYYADLKKAQEPNARSTKNFESMSEARTYMASKGGKGVIIEKPGAVKACGFCPVFSICSQKDEYEHE